MFFSRIIVDIFLFLSILFMPWWITLGYALVLVFLFNNFIEIIIGGLIMDFLYGFSSSQFGGIFFISFLGGLSFYLIIEYLKKKLKFY